MREKLTNTPQFVQAIVEQLGGMQGAPVYCGGRNFIYYSPDQESPLHTGPHDGIFLFQPNTETRTLMMIVLEVTDVYTVKLLYVKNSNWHAFEVMSEVYCDNLQKTVEQMYDDFISQRERLYSALIT